MYRLGDFIDADDPILQKGLHALDQRRMDLFEQTINDPNFDAASFTARALLYEAAAHSAIGAFYALGNRGVPLFDTDQRPIYTKPHALSDRLPDVSIYLEETPLHVLFRKSNLISLFDLDLGSHFYAADLMKTFNTVAQKQYQSVRASSTDSTIVSFSVLDTLWQNYQKQLQFFENRSDDESQISLNLRMAQFLSNCLQFMPDLTIPHLFQHPTLLKNAFDTLDIPCIYVLANPTITLLNRQGYFFSQKEAVFFKACLFVEETVKNEMKCPTLPIPQIKHLPPAGFWQRLKNRFTHQL